MISLDQAKSHLHITSNADDGYISDLIETAEQYVADDLCVDLTELESQPTPVRQAVLFLIAHWYENREPVTSGATASEPQSIPLAYDSIIWRYRNTTFC